MRQYESPSRAGRRRRQPAVSWWFKWRLAIAAAVLLTVVGGAVAVAGPPYPHWPPLPQSSPSPTVAKLSANPPTVSFGTVQVGAASAAISIAIGNSGGSKSTISPKLSDSTNFSLQDLCSASPLGPNQQCQLQVTFSPKSEGDLGGALSFTATSGQAPKAVTLSGHGQGHAILSCVPPSVAFNLVSRTSTAPATSASVNLTCTNSGNGQMTINSVVLQDLTGKFNIQPNCGKSLSPGAACTVVVGFSTSTLGATFGASILFNDSLGQQAVPVTGYRGFLTICIQCIKALPSIAA